MKFNQEPIYYADRINEVKFANCSEKKAVTLLGYESSVSLDDSLRKMINYIKNSGIKKFTYNYDLEIVNEQTPQTWSNKIF